MTSEDADERNKVIALFDRVATARLQPRAEDDNSDLPTDNPLELDKLKEMECEYMSNITRHSFDDKCHPCRDRFDENRIYTYQAGTLHPSVQMSYRRLQICNQMHSCRPSC